MRVRELAEWLGATFEGDGEREILRAAALETAGHDDLSFTVGKKGAKAFESSAAGCVIVAPEQSITGTRTIIRHPDPRRAFARAITVLHPAPQPAPGIHPSAVVSPSAEIGGGVTIGPHSTIGDSARIGAGTVIGGGCHIGSRVSVGAGSRLHPRVTLYDDVELGERCILHAGAVVGADGFGFAPGPHGWEKFPQIGRVVIGNDVEIGANTCIDRAALGVTWIGDGAKFDNQVHIGHNCRIGRHVVIAAQTGLAGGCAIEDWAVIGGQVGFGENVRVESGAVIGSGAGILSNKIVHAGQPVWGTPARPLREYLEQLANLARLPELRKQVEEIRRHISSSS